MALRISKKEKKWLYQKNASANRKAKRLATEFNIQNTFKTIRPSSFRTRKELNDYKKSLSTFLKRSTHKYVSGTGTYVKYIGNKEIIARTAIPQKEFTEIRKIVNRRNERVRRQVALFKYKSYEVKGVTIKGSSTYGQIFSLRPPKHELQFKYSQYHKIDIDKSYFTSERAWKKFAYGVKKYQTPLSILERQLIMKKNYIEALHNTFGKNADLLTELVDKLSIDDFMTFYESERFSDFDYIYDEVLRDEVLKYMTEHMVNYVKELKPRGITDRDVYEALEYVNSLTEEAITEEYNKGKLGGKRIKFKVKGENGQTYWNYIDLSPTEVIEVEKGKALVELNDFENRTHYIKIGK